ncbi:MAG: hypothetical protein IJG06_06575, partial [Clostridia bacterium]|nr:hypothetical protein [Clostridia bacterium]
LVHHQRTVKGGIATLNVRQMYFTADGWPIVTPERYNPKISHYTDTAVNWDIIRIGGNTNAMLTSERLILRNDHTAECGGKTGTWESIHHYGDIIIKLGDETISMYPTPCWDYDNNRLSEQFVGVNQDGIEIWGKKAINTIIYK